MDFIDAIQKLKGAIGDTNTDGVFLKTILESALESQINKGEDYYKNLISVKDDTYRKYMSKKININKTLEKIKNYVETKGIKKYIKSIATNTTKKELVEAFEDEIDNIEPKNAIEKVSEYLIKLIINNSDIKNTIKKRKKRFDNPENNKEIAKKIKKLAEKLNAPPKVDVPENIDTKIESKYIGELYKAYGDAENIKDFDENTLKKYSDYEEDFMDRRIEFYTAETINRGFKEIGDDFIILKKEIHNGIKDTVRQWHENGYERMLNVLNFATNIPLVEYQYGDKNWINTNIRKGVCQHLVNDGKIKWVK